MVGGVQVVLAGVVDDPVERAVGLDPEQLVDLAERQVVASAWLIAAWIGEPRAQADALDECRRLPARGHDGCSRLASASRAPAGGQRPSSAEAAPRGRPAADGAVSETHGMLPSA